MSEKQFEEHIRKAIADYPSKLDKEAMYQDFKSRRKKDRVVVWPLFMVGLSLVAGYFLFSNFGSEPGSLSIANAELMDITSPLESITEEKDINTQEYNSLVNANELTKAEIIAKKEEKQTVKEINAAKRNDTQTSNIITQAENETKDRLGNKSHSEYRPGGEPEGLGLKNVITKAPRADKTLQALPRSIAFIEWKDKEKTPDIELNVGSAEWVQPRNSIRPLKIAPIASYVFLTDNKVDDFITTHRAEEVAFGLQAEIPISKDYKWSFVPSISYKKYNLTQEGSVLVDEGYTSFSTEALSAMIIAIDNHNYLPTNIGETKTIGYTSRQEISALGIGAGISYNQRLNSSLLLEATWSPHLVWNFGSAGSWQNNERTAFLDDYAVDNLNAVHFVSSSSIGIEKNYGSDRTLKLGLKWDMDLTERRSTSNNFDRLSGFGAYLGFGFSF